MFKPLLWSFDFSKMDPVRDRKTVILNGVNYGTLKHWRWLSNYYGRDEVGRFLASVDTREIKPRTRRLVALVFPQ